MLKSADQTFIKSLDTEKHQNAEQGRPVGFMFFMNIDPESGIENCAPVQFSYAQIVGLQKS